MEQDPKKQRDSILAIIGIIFFIGLAIFARSSASSKKNLPPPSSSSPTSSPTETSNAKKEGIDSLLDEESYSFTYTVVLGDATEVLDGKVFKNKMMFTIIGNGQLYAL